MPVAPLCNPQNFFCSRRDETRPREFSHTTCNQGTHGTTFFTKLQRVEGQRIASAVRQRRQLWEPFRVVQYIDDLQMIKATSRVGCISQMEREWDGMAGMVEGCDFCAPKIIGLYHST